MSDSERLKKLLDDAKIDMEQLDDWVKSQEPAPGVSYKDWAKAKQSEQDRRHDAKNGRVAGPFAARA